MDYAACVNQEVQAMFAAGADIVQLDEPWLRQNPDEARQYAAQVIDKALEGGTGHHRLTPLFWLCGRGPRQTDRVCVFNQTRANPRESNFD